MFYRFGSEIFIEPLYGLPGKINETFKSPIYTALNYSLTYHGKNREELELEARVIPWGKFIQISGRIKRLQPDLWSGFCFSYLCQEAGH